MSSAIMEFVTRGKRLAQPEFHACDSRSQSFHRRSAVWLGTVLERFDDDPNPLLVGEIEPVDRSQHAVGVDRFGYVPHDTLIVELRPGRGNQLGRIRHGFALRHICFCSTTALVRAPWRLEYTGGLKTTAGRLFPAVRSVNGKRTSTILTSSGGRPRIGSGMAALSV